MKMYVKSSAKSTDGTLCMPETIAISILPVLNFNMLTVCVMIFVNISHSANVMCFQSQYPWHFIAPKMLSNGIKTIRMASVWLAQFSLFHRGIV